ncbi:MAG: Fe-S cluster assembly sulfur transfer protein SufU [Candidatus Baltobacteraceae bacterium]
MDDFYRDFILDHYRNPRNFGHLPEPDAVAEDRNPLCGDEMRVEIAVDDAGNVSDIRFSGKGCAISQASASMLIESVKGKSLESILSLGEASVLENVGIDISPTRMKCAMLGLGVLKSAALAGLAKVEPE